MTTLILGRDGMGELATEDDFDAWVAYVCEHIDDACGFVVDVETRGNRDVQALGFRGCESAEEETISNALVDLWERFCESSELWPSTWIERLQDAARKDLAALSEERFALQRDGLETLTSATDLEVFRAGAGQMSEAYETRAVLDARDRAS